MAATELDLADDVRAAGLSPDLLDGPASDDDVPWIADACGAKLEEMYESGEALMFALPELLAEARHRAAHRLPVYRPRVLVRSARPAARRAPRSRRVRARSGSRGSPGGEADDPDVDDRPRAEP